MLKKQSQAPAPFAGLDSRILLDADMQKVCLLPQPGQGIFNNFRTISNKKFTIQTYLTNKYYIFPLKLTKYNLFYHFKHKQKSSCFDGKQPFFVGLWRKFLQYLRNFCNAWSQGSRVVVFVLSLGILMIKIKPSIFWS